MSMHASATSAPGTIWWVAARRDAGQSASSSAVIATSLGIQLAQVRRAAACAGPAAPSPAGAAPQIRASERNVFEVAAAWSGAPAAQQLAGVAGDLGADLAAQLRGSARRRAAPSRSTSRASRAAPSGSDQATSGASSAPPAISSEPPPMSKTASRPADQPNQRRTARNVSRASSSPDSTSMRDAGLLVHVVEHVVGVAGVAHRRGGEAERPPRSPCPRPRRRTRRRSR